MLKKIILHPAFLLAIGNTALAFGHAGYIAIALNLLLVLAIFISRCKEVIKDKPFGVSFNILALVNFITAGFVIYNVTNSKKMMFISYVSALAYIAWGIGHILAGINERQIRKSNGISDNPQVFYGIGDMSAVNAGGSINAFSAPFMAVGFTKSIFIGKRIRTKDKFVKFIDRELTAARIYGVGYLVGAITSLPHLYFVIAQLSWCLAYFQFKKDT